MEIRLVVCKCTAGGGNPKHVHVHMEGSHEGLGWCLVLMQLQRPSLAAVAISGLWYD